VSASHDARVAIFQIFPPKSPRIFSNAHHEMTADYQAARAAQSGPVWQTGADRAGECRWPDTRQLLSIDGGWRLDTTWRSRGALRPKLCDLRCPRKRRGRRESRVPMTPAVVRKNAHGGPQVRRNTRPSLRSGFNGLCRALPGDEFVLPPSLTDWRSIEARSGPTISISLTPATGARTTRFCRPQLPQAIRLDRPACCRKKFRPRRLSTVRLTRHPIAHGNNRPATTRAPDAAASTATRPNVRDDGQRPSSRDRMAGVVGLIWVPR
jgi:hypothetical protein